MNILKKAIAPITEEGWREITDQADKIFKTHLTARKFVDVDGPNGMDYGAVSTGKLILPEKHSKKGINWGMREVLPLVEIRKPFELDIWELDNIDRGAKDVNLEPMENAAREVANFEENAIYYGFEKGRIKGLKENAEEPSIVKTNDPDDLLKIIGEQLINLEKEGVEGPYTLVADLKNWKKLISVTKGFPVIKQLKEIIKGEVILNHHNNDSFLVSEQGGDYELILGQDISIGYESHDNEKVKLYFTESFTFRVLSPEAIRVLSNMD
jgi:uncharacterized linocin/CFP29 family protein